MNVRYRVCFMAALVLLTLSLCGVPHHAVADSGGNGGDNEPVVKACGVERWAVKTGTDPDARLVNQRVVVPTTVTRLRTLPAPAEPPLHNRVRPVETTVWAVDAILLRYRYKEENDSDYHLVIADTGGRTMIAEIPAPACVGSSSPFLAGIKVVRNVFTARFHPTRSWQRVHVRVHVVGVGFFDFKHGQSGVAPNAIELHPVLGIWWSGAPAVLPTPSAAGAPTPSPTSSTGTGASLAVRVSVSPDPTTDGTATTVAATTAPGASCTVSVVYASGSRSGSKSLATSETADATGRVAWTWTPSTHTPGMSTATVQCTLGQQSATGTISYTVQ